ncbi:MAG: hypothetical protein RLZZ337_1093 [Bacteroidota bacterium]|jgi:pimeloyl-ACP methyl ester carboxylesterase
MEKIIIFILGRYLNFVNLFSKKWGGKQAFLVFCYPFPTKLKPKQAEFYKTSERIDFVFEEKRIACYKWGRGAKVILCLHGWQSQTFRWKKFIETLDKELYTIIAVDAPGHGNSEGRLLHIPKYSRLVEYLIQSFKVDYILAHSMGAFASLNLFHQKPELSPEKIAVLGTPGEVSDFLALYSFILGLSARSRKNMEEYIQAYFNATPSDFSIRKIAATQHTKGLIIHDKDDKEAPFHYAELVHEIWENADIHVTEGLGHKLRSIEVVDRVVSFFED